jgi:hypothetical protein
MEMTKISKEEKILLDIYRKIYKECTPSADYDQLLKDETTNFKSYNISMLSYYIIVEEALKGNKLTNLKKAVLKNILNNSETLPEIKRL